MPHAYAVPHASALELAAAHGMRACAGGTMCAHDLFQINEKACGIRMCWLRTPLLDGPKIPIACCMTFGVWLLFLDGAHNSHAAQYDTLLLSTIPIV